MKKIMFLGGSTQQIPAIQYAMDQGYYTIVCDYLIDNPGQNYCDKFYCVSTTNPQAILEVAKNEKIDGILAYASDPAALTAAYVGKALNLPSNPYESVLILSKKNLFRQFLKTHDFNCPLAECFKSKEEAKAKLFDFQYPIMIKPIDSSGSKGVTKIDSEEGFEEAFEVALAQSRDKTVILEEYIEMAHECMIGGDCFIIDGKLEFCGMLNSHRDPDYSPFVPIGTSYPLFVDPSKKPHVHAEIQRLLTLLDMKMGAINIEVMFDKKDNLFIIEIGPRNGGNMIPELLKMITGVDLISASVELALGNSNIQVDFVPQEGYYSTYVIHSSKQGTLKEIVFEEGITENVIKKVLYKEKGSIVEFFDGANKALGIVFLKFKNMEELRDKMKHMYQYIHILFE